jgi:phosphatidylserine/phosphatidylglycerophosphate/cardiolipin synthase-like enzyme
MENQYFRSPDLARWIVAQGKAQPSLIVIVVVVANAGNDDGANAVTRHGDFLQFAFFDSIVSALGAARVRIYTMVQRAVHAKFVLVDDAWMCIGSANANVRSFQLDTELNVQTGAGALVNSFRTRLWAWNLGQTAATVASWPVSDFLAQWDSVAKANAAVSAPRDMVGEGVVGFDYKTAPGKRSLLIPDAFAQLDVSFEPSLFAGDDGGGSGTDGGDGANTANSTAPA